MPKLSVQLVTWNGAKYVPNLFDSLRNQNFADWKLTILDNHSTDGMVDAMKKELERALFQYEFIENAENKGFAGGHNQMFGKGEGEYVLLLNQDMLFSDDCFGTLTAFLDTHTDIAAISPRLMRWDFEQRKTTENIDSLGLKVFRNRRIIEQRSGDRWVGTGQEFLPVFGVSGAFPMFRRSALLDVAFVDGTFFDGSYHSYKEDTDLAYRLQSRGYSAAVVLNAVAYHDRSAAGPRELHDEAAAENKRTQSPWVKYYSYKNHLMTLYKNEYWQNVLLDFPWIVWYEGKKLVYFILFDRSVLKGIGEIWKMRKELRQKRIEIQKKRRVDSKVLRHWWV